MEIVILAAGRGVRMGRLTESTPKPLLEVNGKPLLQHLLDRVRLLHHRQIIVVVHYLADKMREWLAAAAPDAAAIDQGEADGTARAVACAEPLIESDQFLVLNGDNYYTADDLARLTVNDGFHHLGVIPSAEPWRYGVIEDAPDRPGFAARILEKPKDWPAGRGAMINAGVYLFRRDVFTVLHGLIARKETLWQTQKQEIKLTDALDQLAAARQLRSIPLTEWHDMGTEEDLKMLDCLLRERSR